MRGGLFLGICAAILAATVSTASAVTLYSTSFDNPPFAPNPGYWAGVDGWLATDPSNGSAAVVPSGGAVYLGHVQPSGPFSGVERTFGLDPAALGVPIVKIHTKLMVVASTNGHYDVFGFVIYNRAGEFLWSFLLDASNGSGYFDPGTGAQMLSGQFQSSQFFEVGLTINLSTNRASLTIYDSGGNSYPIFENRTFHESGHALDLGELDYQWWLNSPSAAGDNFMVVDSLSVEAQANPALVIAKGTRQRTKADSYILRGGQAAEDDVRIEWKSKTQWRWTPVRGAATNWTIRLRRLTKGRNAVQIRMLDALGRTIDQQNVNILRK
jgi:hypothetical protein